MKSSSASWFVCWPNYLSSSARTNKFVRGLLVGAGILLSTTHTCQAQGSPEAPKHFIDYFGVSFEAGAGGVYATSLNKYFAANTTSHLSEDAQNTRVALIIGNAQDLCVSFYFSKLQTLPTLDVATPSFSLESKTFGYEFSKILLNKRIRIVLPSLGVAYRFNTLTYSAGNNGALPLITLFQQYNGFTIASRNIAGTGGAGVYYKTHLLQTRGIKEIDFGLNGEYGYSFINSNWQLKNGGQSVQVPPQRLNQYSVRLTVGLFVER